MDFSNLTKDELLAFVGLMEQILIADAAVTDAEKGYLDVFINQIGEHNYRSYLFNYRKTFMDIERFKMFLMSIDRQEAREFIYGKLFELSQIDFIHKRETDILDWLAIEWQLDIDYESIEES